MALISPFFAFAQLEDPLPEEPLKPIEDLYCYPADEKPAECYFSPEKQEPKSGEKDASYTVELPVSYFSNSLTGGTKTGVSPYLDARDYNANYLSMSSSGSSGYYYFDDVVGDMGTITKVELVIYEKRDIPPSENYGEYYLTNSASYYVVGLDEGLDYFVENIDDVTNLSGLAEWTWTAVNEAKIYVKFYKFTGDSAKLYVDEAKLVVTYTPSAGGGEAIDYTDQWDYTSSTVNLWLGLIFMCLLILIYLSFV